MIIANELESVERQVRLYNQDSGHSEVLSSMSEPVQSRPPKIATTFVRREDKYLVPSGLYGLFVSVLDEHMQPGYPIPGISYTFIESLYYDSAQLRFFHDHFRSLPLRFKLRTRRYAPDGEWQTGSPHLELKSKHEGVCKKERFRIGHNEIQSLTNGQPLIPGSPLTALNSEMDEQTLCKRVERVNCILESLAPRPVCAVRYVRRAFEQDGLRVTVDCGIRSDLIGPLRSDAVVQAAECPLWYKMHRMGRKIQDDSHFLLEVKHSGATFNWLEEMLRAYGLKKTSFSKYCYTMARFVLAQTPR